MKKKKPELTEVKAKINAEAVVMQQATVETMADELRNVIDAGNSLAEAAHFLQANFDGIHRLRLALSNWYKVRADEFGRKENSLSA